MNILQSAFIQTSLVTLIFLSQEHSKALNPHYKLMSCKMSADKTKAVLNIGIEMFPFQISYVKNMHIK